jgi:hypothetical protein
MASTALSVASPGFCPPPQRGAHRLSIQALRVEVSAPLVHGAVLFVEGVRERLLNLPVATGAAHVLRRTDLATIEAPGQPLLVALGDLGRLRARTEPEPSPSLQPTPGVSHASEGQGGAGRHHPQAVAAFFRGTGPGGFSPSGRRQTPPRSRPAPDRRRPGPDARSAHQRGPVLPAGASRGYRWRGSDGRTRNTPAARCFRAATQPPGPTREAREPCPCRCAHTYRACTATR